MLRRLRAIANSPWTPAVLVLYFVLDLWCLGSRYTNGCQTDTARTLYVGLVGPVHFHPNFLAAEVWRNSSGELVMLLDYEWDDHPENLIGAHRIDGITLSTGGGYLRNGLYAPTQSTVILTPNGFYTRALSIDQQTQFRDEFITRHIDIGALPNDLTPQERSDVIAGRPVIRTTHHPLGYLHNTLSLAMFLMLLWSLRLNVPKLFRRRDPTRCPHCSYSTIGLPTTTCPECGGSITISP